MSHSIKKLREDSIPSPSRLWYNNWVAKHAKGHVLDVGKSTYWDYGFTTFDTNPRLKPDIVGDICFSGLFDDMYDTVLCNGMYEFVINQQLMVDEVMRILKPGGKAIFGFVGKNYEPYKKPWYYYEEGKIDFKNIIKKKDFNNYHFIVCQKSYSQGAQDSSENTSSKN